MTDWPWLGTVALAVALVSLALGWVEHRYRTAAAELGAYVAEIERTASPDPRWETIHTSLVLSNSGRGDAKSVDLVARFFTRSSAAPPIALALDPPAPYALIVAGSRPLRIELSVFEQHGDGWVQDEPPYPFELEITWKDGSSRRRRSTTITLAAPVTHGIGPAS